MYDNNEVNAKIATFMTDVDLAHLIVHGGPETVVMTDGGPVRSYANVIGQLDAELNAMADTVLGQVLIARDDAVAASATAGASATAAGASATSASNSATLAGNSATAAATSATGASSSATTASTAATSASSSAASALASAVVAVNAPGTTATSTSSLTIGTGARSLSLGQLDKAFAVGQWVYLVDQAAPSANWMHGTLTAFTPGTGAMTVNVVAAAGSGIISSWLVMPASPSFGQGLAVGADGSLTLTGKLNTPASTVDRASLKVPHGVAPTVPVNGDMWTTTAALLVRVNGATKTVAFTDSAITGNAATATKLATARNINGVAFDGSAAITISAATPNALTAGGYLTGGAFNGSAAVTIAVDATSANTASKVVARDTSGNFSAGTITASLSGVATSATKLATARNINGVAFDGSAAISINLNSSLTAGSYLTGGSFNGSAAITLAVDATSANTANKVVARDASGNFSAGTITAALSGNASTATKLATARAINGVNFDGSSAITIADGTKLPLAGGTMTGKLTTDASAAAAAGLNIPHGAAPTTPANGDIWSTTAGLLIRINGATKTVAFTDSSITGNAATATKLATSRTINGVGFDGSANITVADGTKVPLAGGTMTGGLEIQSASVNNLLKLTNDGAYISGYDSAETARTGYLQFNKASYVRLQADLAIPMVFGTSGAERFRLEATGKGKFTAGAYTDTETVAFSATPTFDCNASNYFEFGTLTANVTSMTLSNASGGQSISIRFVQDGGGGNTVALPAGAKVEGSIATGANRVSFLNLVRSTAGARWEGNWFQLPA